MTKESDFKPLLPVLSEGSGRDFYSESSIAQLPLYSFSVELSCRCVEVTRIFEKYPLLPGVVLLENGSLAGMLSRQRLLEYLIRPRAIDLFLHAPVQTIYSYARTSVLTLPEQTLIVDAARVALRRSPELLSEPILVRRANGEHELLNVHELNIAYWHIRGIETQLRFEQMQTQMIQTEKMASLGRLVDGVAHEILDPVGFIWGNLTYVSEYGNSLLELISAYEQCFPEIPDEIADLSADIELDFLKQDLPRALSSIKNGAERLRKLAFSLQNFCHIDDVYPKPADLHACIDSVLLLLQSRLSSEIEIIKNYGDLPPVPCYAGQLIQVFVNIISFCIDGLINQAVSQKFEQEFRDPVMAATPIELQGKSRIEIVTEVSNRASGIQGVPPSRWIWVKISDNGLGMSPPELQELQTSFTHGKKGDKETSLSSSYWIITAKHGGELHVSSQLDEGTAFEILLPLL